MRQIQLNRCAQCGKLVTDEEKIDPTTHNCVEYLSAENTKLRDALGKIAQVKIHTAQSSQWSSELAEEALK